MFKVKNQNTWMTLTIVNFEQANFNWLADYFHVENRMKMHVIPKRNSYSRQVHSHKIFTTH